MNVSCRAVPHNISLQPTPLRSAAELGRSPVQTAIVPRTNTTRRMAMKYMISWFERPQGSPAEYENAQKRILEVFGQWKAPAGFKIELFVVRVGE